MSKGKRRRPSTEPPFWWFWLGLTFITAGLVALMMLPPNAWGF